MSISVLTLSNMKGYLEVLNELSETHIKQHEYHEAYDYINNQNKIVIITLNKDLVIGTASLLFEYKLIHGFSVVGHIEDVVVRKGYRNAGVGKSMINHLLSLADTHKCYKVILNCDAKNIGFYEKHGFKNKEIMMRKNLSN